jgi:hypothetical protein
MYSLNAAESLPRTYPLSVPSENGRNSRRPSPLDSTAASWEASAGFAGNMRRWAASLVDKVTSASGEATSRRLARRSAGAMWPWSGKVSTRKCGWEDMFS